MISAGTGSVKQQFYEKGSLEAIDWGEVAGKSTVGGIIGTGTSYGGAKLSQGTTYLLSKNATVSSLLYSESAATRAASNFVVSGTAEVVSGGITRFAGGVLTTGGNVKEAWAQAINPQSILFDATLGASMGGVKGLQKPQQNSAVINSDGTASGVQEINKPRQYSGDSMSPEDAVKLNQWNKFRENGLDINVENDILLTNKGLRPDPSTYLSDNYIKEHLTQFDDGITVLQTKKAYNKHSARNGYVGRSEDNSLFVMPKEYADELLSKANGNYSYIEEVLGLEKGSMKRAGGLVRIDADTTSEINIRIPSGNEEGANRFWLPGGYTSGGVPEAVTNTVPLDKARITEIKGK